jgi:hypothetical protein
VHFEQSEPITTMIEDYPTTSEAREQAEEYATPLDQLINPSDVQDDAEQWTDIDADTIRFECAESAGIIASEHREMRNLIQDAAFRLWADSMKRVSRDVLGDAANTELVRVYGIQPNDMSNAELYEIMHVVFEESNARIPNGFVEEARAEVEAGLIEGTKPDL